MAIIARYLSALHLLIALHYPNSSIRNTTFISPAMSRTTTAEHDIRHIEGMRCMIVVYGYKHI